MRKSFALLLLIVTLLALRPAPSAQAQTFPVGHDNTTAPHNWTHGDPNIGLTPGGDGYYYLKAKAPSSGSIVGNCEVYTPFAALNLRLEDANKNILAQGDFVNSGGRVYATGLTPGALYQCRIENDGPDPVKDYAELNLFAQGDMTTSDCGGPGPVLDPNWDTAPMEPAHTAGLPANGCNGVPGADPYNASDIRANLPAQETFDLGLNTGSRTTTVTTTRTADLTVFVFYGSQGTSATLTIEDAAGNVVNGPKWGAAESNPRTMNQEYVGADAGVVPPGTYTVIYSGPTNTQHLLAISGAA